MVMKKIFFVLGRLEQPKQNENLLYRHDKPNELTKERPLSFELFESSFASVLIVSWGHPSLVSTSARHAYPVNFVNYNKISFGDFC